MDTKRDLYIAKTFAGLESVLVKELQDIGAEDVQQLRRAVSFRGDLQTLYRANIWCRTALSILKQLHSFTFENKESFYEEMRQVDWTAHFDKDKTISVIPVAHDSDLFVNTMYLAQLSKDAIADSFKEKYGSRPNVDTARANIRINVQVHKNKCNVSLDSSGEALFKRGYRRSTGVAPINEILAAGLIMLSGWDLKSPFIDPMCGSGTFSIEAAMMSANMAPGAERKEFGFSHWSSYNEDLFLEEQQSAHNKKQKVQAEIIASDIKGYLLDHTRQNIMNAGLMGSIKVQRNDFFTYRPPFDQGWVILNPPYGKRMTHSDIDELHKSIGEALKHRFAGFKAGIISAEINAMRHIGLRPSKKVPVYNGPLICTFNVYELFSGRRDDMVREKKKEVSKGRPPRPRLKE